MTYDDNVLDSIYGNHKPKTTNWLDGSAVKLYCFSSGVYEGRLPMTTKLKH